MIVEGKKTNGEIANETKGGREKRNVGNAENESDRESLVEIEVDHQKVIEAYPGLDRDHLMKGGPDRMMTTVINQNRANEPGSVSHNEANASRRSSCNLLV